MSLVTLSRPGCQLHGWLEGPPERPLVVLVHGAGLDRGLFQHNVPALAERWRTLVVDVRGHGESRPLTVPYRTRDVLDDLLAWLDELGTRDAIWIGQSMGGNLAQEMARIHPERVRALVLVDCACNSAGLGTMNKLAMRIVPALLKLYPREAMLRQSGRAGAVNAAVQAYIGEVMSRLDADELAAVLRETFACVREAPDYRIPRPFLLVRGAESHNAAVVKEWPRWAAREPNCRRHVCIAQAGHAVNMDQPEAFNREVLSFLADLDQGSPQA